MSLISAGSISLDSTFKKKIFFTQILIIKFSPLGKNLVYPELL
jgi:hypothetical protein